MGVSQALLARHIKVDYKVINRIVNGNPSLTPDIALRLSKAFEQVLSFRLNLQQKVDIYEAKEKLKDLTFSPIEKLVPL